MARLELGREFNEENWKRKLSRLNNVLDEVNNDYLEIIALHHYGPWMANAVKGSGGQRRAKKDLGCNDYLKK
ncbi:hypothetical protein Glove_141g14 [Diversispora epigaea]|uniref:Uncharacterized protein n=1 Tax=Diversispora epigaea TaxID=1348612 RepID=A0A397J3T2_9GLOM|nr:hypothetical protein Glove_141g14 [Diversispora epigaea]